MAPECPEAEAKALKPMQLMTNVETQQPFMLLHDVSIYMYMHTYIHTYMHTLHHVHVAARFIIHNAAIHSYTDTHTCIILSCMCVDLCHEYMYMKYICIYVQM